MTYSDLKADFDQAQKYLDILEPDGNFTLSVRMLLINSFSTEL